MEVPEWRTIIGCGFISSRVAYGLLWGSPEAFLGFHSWKGGGRALGLSHESHGTKKGTEEIWSTDNMHERLKDDVESFLPDAFLDPRVCCLSFCFKVLVGLSDVVMRFFFLLILVCAVLSHLCGAGNWAGTDSVLFLYLDHSRAEGTFSSCHGITACN